ncbi:leucine-rich repeat receptor-like tyrosine-protein kinase PXC3 [Tanacetum coccineum]
MFPGRHVARDKWNGIARMGYLPGRHRRAHIVSVKQLSATVEDVCSNRALVLGSIPGPLTIALPLSESDYDGNPLEKDVGYVISLPGSRALGGTVWLTPPVENSEPCEADVILVRVFPIVGTTSPVTRSMQAKIGNKGRLDLAKKSKKRRRKQLEKKKKKSKRHNKPIIILGSLFVENLKTTIDFDAVVKSDFKKILNNQQWSLAQFVHESSKEPVYKPDWPVRLSIVVGVVEGLVFLHHLAIIHLDISYGNIFLDPNFKPMVGEVEISKLLDPSHGTASISAVAGSFGYIAPAKKNKGKDVEVEKEIKEGRIRHAWTQAEELLLAESFLQISEDPKTGCDQKLATFWYKILDVYNKEANKKGFQERTKNTCDGASGLQ